MDTIPTRVTRDHAQWADQLKLPGQHRTDVLAEALEIGLMTVERRRAAAAEAIAKVAVAFDGEVVEVRRAGR